MLKYKQLETDDCWRTCIASILQLPVNEVPHFYKLDKEQAVEVAKAWLHPKGFGLIAIALPGEYPLSTILDCAAHMTSGNFYYIISGKTKRGLNHAMVGHLSKIVLDPYTGEPPILNEAPFVGPLSNGVWSIEIIAGLV